MDCISQQLHKITVETGALTILGVIQIDKLLEESQLISVRPAVNESIHCFLFFIRIILLNSDKKLDSCLKYIRLMMK